jgi:tetratricopeptide (TPR) repeat protein
MLIDIQQACVSANFGGKNIDKVKNLIIQFDKLKVELKINEKVSSYELINKIKGDYWFKTGDYLSAISYYTKTIEMMKNSDPKKPVVYFNLGCACYFYKKYQKAIENLNLCINAYRVFEYEQKTYDVLTRRDVIIKKVKNIKRLIGLMENQKMKN